MKPRDILLQNVERHIVQPLQAIGFNYAPSKISFSRKVGIASQHVSFSLGKWNYEDDCTFWTMWGAGAPAYTKWHKKQFGRPPANNFLGCLSDWNIPGWSRKCSQQAVLRNNPQDADVMSIFLEDAIRAGVPFLESISTWRGAAEHQLREGFSYDRAVDFFVIADEPARARETALNGIQRYTTEGVRDGFLVLPELRLRLAKFFPERNSVGASE